MKLMRYLATTILGFGLLACSESEMPAGDSPSDPLSELVILGDDLQKLKDDFNGNQGRVRLMFLNGPTCGICLRGMADLNDEFLAINQQDDRLVTFVVHVPTMGAKAHHAKDSMPLLDGPRIHHYWEDTGIIGQHYAEVMGVDMYVWDFWAIYGPEHVWSDTLPPTPDYYEHQLGVTRGEFRGFPKQLVLDAGRFAARTSDIVESLGTSEMARPATAATISGEQVADGTFIPKVGQPRNVAVRQHIMGRGGYKNLKRIQSITKHGQIEAGASTYDLTIIASRTHALRRLIGQGNERPRGFPELLEQKLVDTFEFDGLFVEWPDKGHDVSMSGMLKIGDSLAWRLRLSQSDGPEWHLFVDSHTGALIRKDLLDDKGNVEFSIRQNDFRETAGFMFAHRIEYLDRTGVSLGVETIDVVDVVVESFDLDDDSVTH